MVELFHLYFEVAGRPHAVRPLPDLRDPVNMVASACHRFAREMPRGTRPRRARFLRFAKHFIRRAFPVLDGGTDVSLETWLAESSYNETQKRALRMAFYHDDLLKDSDFDAESFLKDEHYPEFKYPRSINAYPLRNKANCGPIQHALDKAVFSTKWSVKFLTMPQRAARMAEKFGRRPVDVNDSSSFEAHH